jgi:hypothetical protein
MEAVIQLLLDIRVQNHLMLHPSTFLKCNGDLLLAKALYLQERREARRNASDLCNGRSKKTSWGLIEAR